jgi:hypothetical protein
VADHIKAALELMHKASDDRQGGIEVTEGTRVRRQGSREIQAPPDGPDSEEREYKKAKKDSEVS